MSYYIVQDILDKNIGDEFDVMLEEPEITTYKYLGDFNVENKWDGVHQFEILVELYDISTKSLDELEKTLTWRDLKKSKIGWRGYPIFKDGQLGDQNYIIVKRFWKAGNVITIIMSKPVKSQTPIIVPRDFISPILLYDILESKYLDR